METDSFGKTTPTTNPSAKPALGGSFAVEVTGISETRFWTGLLPIVFASYWMTGGPLWEVRRLYDLSVQQWQRRALAGHRWIRWRRDPGA